MTFTSTGDFDAGTKSQPSPVDGNYQVETNTDNPGISVGSLELTNLKGDSFTLADADADTFKWDTDPADCTVAGGTQTREITSGSLTLRINTPPDGNARLGVVTSSTSSGAVDIRMSFDGIVAPTVVHLFAQNERACYLTATSDGIVYEISGGPDASYDVRAFTFVNNVATICGAVTALTIDPVWLRVTRSGDAWTFYYSSDGSSFTTDEGPCTQVAGAVYAAARIAGNGFVDNNIAVDNFYVAAGTIDAGGFRTTGTWTSATQTFAGEVVAQIDLTFSGATSSNYIDQVAVLDGSGVAIFIDDTNIVSETTATIVVGFSQLLVTNWAIRITLAGANAGTVNVASIDVTISPPPAGEEGGGNRRVTVACELQWLTQAIACLDSTNYGSATTHVTEVAWYLDGRYVRSTWINGRVSLPTRDTFHDARINVTHTVTMEVRLDNGGRQRNLIVVSGDYTPRFLLFFALFFVAIFIVMLAFRHFRTRSASFQRVSNPSYRRTAISVDEEPSGWVSYRQRDPDRYASFRSRCIRKVRGKCTIIAVFGLRPATPAERARTGRPRVAELQTVRERMPKPR